MSTWRPNSLAELYWAVIEAQLKRPHSPRELAALIRSFGDPELELEGKSPEPGELDSQIEVFAKRLEMIPETTPLIPVLPTANDMALLATGHSDPRWWPNPAAQRAA